MRIHFRVVSLTAATVALLTATAARADYSSTVLGLNPAGYWPLNEATAPPGASVPVANNLGTLGAAMSGSFSGDVVFGYPGALAGTTDSADSFNGFTTRVVAPYSTDVSTAPSFTIEAWLRSHDDGTIWGTTCPLSDGNLTSPRKGWLIYQNVANVGQLTFRAYATNGTSASLSMNIGAPGSVALEKWYHVAIVVSNAVTVTNVYAFINGVQAAGPVVLPAYVPNDGLNGAFTIGGRSDGDSYDYTGVIDEVAYYTNALDVATLLAHYQAGTNPAPATAYSALVLQSKPALYYRLNETPVGQPNPVVLPTAANLGTLGTAAIGYYQPGTVPGVAGPTNTGFGTVSKACQFNAGATGNQSGPGVMCDPFQQPLLNIEPALSLTAWVLVPSKPTGFQTPIGRGDLSYRLSIDDTGKPHFAANPNGDVTGPTAVSDGAWHFWAGVFDPATSKSYLYVDSLLVAEGSGSPLVNLSSYLLIGGAPDYGGRGFVGSVAHVALFTNALSAGQIATLYNSVGAAPAIVMPTNGITLNEGANGSLTATVAGTPTINLQWYATDLANVTTAVAGQTTATLNLVNAQATQTGYQYFLVANNAYGSVTSSIVTLTVVQGPPWLPVDVTPASQTVPVGATITYSVVASGTFPLHYQWYQDSAPIIGATDAVYSFPAPSGSHTYSCTVTNNYGPANSTVVTLVGVSTPPPVVTFNTDGTGWTINRNANAANAGITNGTLLLTDGAGSEVATAFFNTPQYNAGFAAFFTYQGTAGSAGMADGTTFCLQNSLLGASAIGGGGGELGYYGVNNSAALLLNIYQYASGGRGIQFSTNGMTPGTPIPTAPYLSTAPVNMGGGHPINVQLYFNQGTYYVYMVDAVTGDKFATTAYQGPMRPTIGADSAYVGFTGATGGDNSTQTIKNFRFSYTTPPVVAVKKTGANLVISWPISVASFFKLQQSSSLSGPWPDVGITPTVVGLENQVTVGTTNAAQFYRLQLN